MNSSNKKPDSEASALKKKVNKGKTEGSENSDLDKTPPPSPAPEEDEDPGVQVMPLSLLSSGWGEGNFSCMALPSGVRVHDVLIVVGNVISIVKRARVSRNSAHSRVAEL